MLHLFAGLHISILVFPRTHVVLGEFAVFVRLIHARSVYTAAGSAGYNPERRFLTSCNIARRICRALELRSILWPDPWV